MKYMVSLLACSLAVLTPAVALDWDTYDVDDYEESAGSSVGLILNPSDIPFRPGSDGYPEPGFGKVPGNGPPDPFGPTGHESGPSFE